jgi:hypothetical protein
MADCMNQYAEWNQYVKIQDLKLPNICEHDMWKIYFLDDRHDYNTPQNILDECNPTCEFPDERGVFEKSGIEILFSKGTFHVINALFYKHTWIDFPDFGKECTAYINSGGVLLESPYFEGEIRLSIFARLYSTPQERDDLKGVLCRLMRTGEYRLLRGGGALIFFGYRIHRDYNGGEILLGGTGASIISVNVGTIHFDGCSC